MSLSDRRAVLIGLAAFGGLAACRFEPALQADRGAIAPLYGKMEIQAPASPADYVMTQRLEDRFGPSTLDAPYLLTYGIRITSTNLGTDVQGEEQRVHLDGRAGYRLLRRGESGALATGTVAQFTGYSSTGNTVTTRAAENDARLRLVTMLADGVAERLLLASPDLPL